MYPYTKELMLDEALKLHEKDRKTRVFFNNKDWEIYCWNIQDVYSEGKSLFCDALTYATHILQAAPPEGWGYAAYELSSGKYEGLHYRSQPSGTSVFRFENQDNTDKWWYYQFKLTDLARVEAESEILQPATCCPKCYEVMTELKQEIADLEAKNKELANAGLNIAHDLATGSQTNEKNLLDRIAELEAKNKELQSKSNSDVLVEHFEQMQANQKLNRLHTKINLQEQIIEKYVEIIKLYNQSK
jgi:hypothetical protein